MPRGGFHDLLQAGALDIFQFDTNRVGGFTEAQRICHMAQVHGVEVIPHGGQMHNLHVCISSFASPMAGWEIIRRYISQKKTLRRSVATTAKTSQKINAARLWGILGRRIRSQVPALSRAVCC